MRPLKNIKSKQKDTFACFVDGETELCYLNMLKRHERDLIVNIIPQIPQRKKLLEQYNIVLEASKNEYTKVFWIVDLDTIIKETKETQKRGHTPLQAFLRYKEKLEKTGNVVVIVNNPCIELWFLLHYIPTSKYFKNCAEAEDMLKKHITNYEKTRTFLTKEGNDIYKRLKPNLNNALQNARAIGDFEERNPQKTVCEMYKLFDALQPYLKL